ncbi:diguanylate cyclase [Demequina sp. SO4-13]|uniref:diguanylate cyclase n=1 Tax=Demequina sp. SO4-13 TaxID=3401027 RepID=UPI003AF60EA1
MSRWLPDASLTRSRAYTLAIATIATILVLQMLTTVVGGVIAGRQYEQVSVDTFEYVGDLTAERVSRFAEAGSDVAEGTANELELLGAGMDRDILEESLHRRIEREIGVRAIYVGWQDGEFMVLRRNGDDFVSQRGGGDAGAQVTTRTFDAEFTLMSREVEPSDYGPRTRPWFMTGTATGMTRWTQPYTDYLDGGTLVSAAHAARRASERGDSVMVTVLDLDDFKDRRDRFGHAVGDEALRAVAAGLTGSARAGDLAARTGGDEFVTLHVLRSEDNPLHVVQRVRDAVEREIYTRVADAEGVGVTAGYATAGIGLNDIDTLVVHADRALVAGKTKAKGPVYGSGDATTDVDRRRDTLHAERREASDDSSR